MRPLLRLCVAVWTALLLAQRSHAECVERACGSNEIQTITTTTTISLSRPNCTFSIGTSTSENGSLAGLTPGAVYQVLVTCLNCCKEITMIPEAVSSITAIGDTTSMSVSWNPAAGRVDSYSVLLYRDNQLVNRSRDLSNTTLSKRFLDLEPGVLYCAVVTTRSGPSENNSSCVYNATFPNPPGPIAVELQTVESISFTWPVPGNMDHNDYNFSVSTINGSVLIENNWFLLSGLQSGSPYNISVVTVGVWNYFSTAETAQGYTRPYSVSWNEVVTLNTTSVRLDWMEPQEYKSEYTYWVQTTGCGSHNNTVNDSHTQISGLIPGTQCTFCVSVIAADGTEGEANCTSQYTEPWTVQPSISSQGFNSSVLVSWTTPPGNVQSFTVYLNSTSLALKEHVLNSTSSSIQFVNLSAGTLYSTRVITHSGQFNASSGFVTNATIPNSPGSIEVLTKTTSSIEIRWMEAPLMTGASFFYKLSITPSPQGRYINTSNTSHTFDSLLSGTSYNISIVTVGAMNFESEKVHIYMVTTRPYSVRWNEVVTLNTTSIRLDWMEPQEYKSEYTYRVQTTGCGSHNNTTTTVNDSHTQISGLIPGTQCTFCVSVIAADGTEGEANCTSQYTEPGTVPPSISSQGSNSSVLVSWTRPPGNVQSFTVYLNSTSLALKEHVLNSTSSSIQFVNLSAGTLYSTRVITHSGQFNASSGFVTNATIPNAPGSIEVLTKTTSSIEIRWMEAPLMTGASFFYKLSNISPLGGRYVNTTNTSHTFDSLLSGTSYNISIVTVGAMNFESKTVHINMVTTRPYSVRWNEVVTLNTTSVRLDWMEPQEYKSEYTYWVQTTGCGSHNNTVSDSHTQISGLTPGTQCTFCVSVIAADGTEGEANCTSQYTEPGTAQPSISSQGSNSSVLVSWTRPRGNVQSFTVYLNSTSLALKEHVLNSTSSSIQFVNLSAGTLYSTRVITHSGQFNASSGFVTNATFPNPPGSIEVLSKTTSSIEIRWMEAPQMTHASFFYKLSITPSRGGRYINTTNTSHTFDSLLSGTSYNISIVTVGAMNFESEKVHINMVTTRPYSVRWNEVVTLNTTSVRLDWMEPQEYKSEYTYWVQTTGCGSQNNTVNDSHTQISGLIPGTQCTFCVSVIAADGTEGEANCTSQYTEPGTVQPSISSQGSNSSVLVSWTRPHGNVQSFTVYLNSTSLALKEHVLNSTSSSIQFVNLSAGTLYSTRVITHSGQFNASSGFVTNATIPNSPGSIEVLTITTSSIEIRWMEAPLMTGASFFYKLSITPSLGGRYVNTTNANYTFDSLLSGTSYNISIVTVGAMNFESKEVHINMVTTRQLFVESVVALIAQEDNITITWPKLTDYTGSFHYNVAWQSQDGLKSITTTETKYTIFDLNPGSRCNYSVTPMTPDGGQGATTSNSTCTNASPVKSLTCESPNKPNAEITLSWTKPRGEHTKFLVSVNESKITNKTSTDTYSHTLLNLHHYTEYTLTVETLSCGQPSTPVSLDCMTGITDPPIPPNFVNMLDVVQKEHNKFFIQINRELLNNSNGPVTHVGVLVTNSPLDDTSNLKMYLGKTYKQWRAKDTPVYLATVKETYPQLRSGGNHLSVEIGDESRWEGYTNGALDANGRYQVAIVVFTSLSLHDGLVNNISLVSVTGLFAAVLLPQNPAVIGLAVGVTLGIFCILLIILIGFIVYWKRVSNKESSDIQIHSLRSKESMPVRIEDYEAYCRKQRADSNCGFAAEFEDLRSVGTGQSKTSAQTFDNKPKNRYNNVLPYDSSRVKLSIIHGSPYDDYINANYMPGYNSRKEFIAAQGPLPATVNEFWRMVWEKNVQTLVMLTRCHEQGRVKCEQYWTSGTKHFEHITVTTTSDIPLEDWTIRDFDIKNVKTAETRSVRQFHFTAWPDHGVPETTELLIGFRHLVREHMDQYSKHSPTVVHCSAGVGRTGTFIAIDTLIFQIERENNVDVYGIVHDLRMHRPLMVQTEDQYVFLHQCTLDIIRSRTGTNVDLIYQNTAAFSIYENLEPIKGFQKNRYHNA